jgi:hypothetical protein
MSAHENFEDWYAEVDAMVSTIAGVGIADLSDGLSYDAFADGVSPTEYAHDRLANDGFPFE